MEEYEEQFSKIASLLGDKVRAVMLWNMLDGRAFTASELAICASVSSQSASNHLNKLVTAKLLVVEKQGRHRYYRYASEEVARVVETMGSLITISEKDRSIPVTTPKDLTFARTCYDHLAGKLGVQVTKALVDNHILVLEEKKYRVTESGLTWFSTIGIDIDRIKSKKRSFAHACLDWSERRYHLAGALGAALYHTMVDKDWIRRKENTREVVLTSHGEQELNARLQLNIRE